MLYLLYMHITVNMSTGLLSASLGCSQSCERKIHLSTLTFSSPQCACYLLLKCQHCRSLVREMEHPRLYINYGFGHFQFHALDAALRMGIL